MTEIDPVTQGNKQYPVGRGEAVPAVLGVTNTGSDVVKGLVVHVHVVDDLDLLRKYDNCWYYVDSNLDGTFCEFDAELAPGATLAFADPVAAVAPDARDLNAIVFAWHPKAYADAAGGTQKLAERMAGKDTTVQRGSGATLTLATRSLPLPEPEDRSSVNFAYPTLILPPSESKPEPTKSVTPSASVSPTPSPQPSGSASPATGGTGGGGSLPVTGAPTSAFTAAGIALLLLGGIGYVIARRRRTNFMA